MMETFDRIQCPVPSCSSMACGPNPMCAICWRRLPKSIQRRVTARRIIAQKDPTEAKKRFFDAALHEALGFIRDRDEGIERDRHNGGVILPIQAPFQSRHEAELADFGISLTADQLTRYRAHVSAQVMEIP